MVGIRSKLEELIGEEEAPAILFDLRDITDTSGLTSEFIRSIPSSAQWSGCHPKEGGKRAMLVSTDVLAGLARVYQGNAGLGEGDDFKIFRDPRPALEYIGILESVPTDSSSTT